MTRCLQGGAVRVLPVEALSGGSAAAQMVQGVPRNARVTELQIHVKAPDGAAHTLVY